MAIADTWHTFMIRKTLLTHWSVCFDFGGPNTSLRDPIIRDTAASSLCIDLLSILDEAVEAVMTPEDYDRGRKMKNRLEMLNKSHQLLDYNSLKAINDRRNEIGHELGKGATVAELDDAITKIKEQLVSWKLIDGPGDYELAFERSAMRGSDVEGYSFEQDMIIRVNKNGRRRFEMKQTQRIANG